MTSRRKTTFPKVPGTETELRAKLKDLRMELRHLSYTRSIKLEELKLLDERYRTVFYHAEAIDRQLTPVKIISTYNPKALVERTISTDEAFRILASLGEQELSAVLKALQPTGEQDQEPTNELEEEREEADGV